MWDGDQFQDQDLMSTPGTGHQRGLAAGNCLVRCQDASECVQECLKIVGDDKAWVLKMAPICKLICDAVTQEETNMAISPVLTS